MKTKFHLSASVSPTEMNCLVRHQPVEQSLFDIPKSRATLLYYEIEMVRRTTFICSSTCRKAEHVEQPRCISDEEGEHGSGHGNKIVNSSNLNNVNFEVEVYPNPTNKGFNLKSNCKENCDVLVIVSNLSGQKITSQTCNLLEGNCFIETNLAQGTYIVSVTKNSTKETVINKLTIVN